MPAGRATRPLASPLAIAPPMAPGPAQLQIASVRTANFTLFDHSKILYPDFAIIQILLMQCTLCDLVAAPLLDPPLLTKIED